MTSANQSKDLAKLARMGIATASGNLAADVRNAKVAAKVRAGQDAAIAASRQIAVAEAMEMHPDLFTHRVTKSGREVVTFDNGTHRKDFDAHALDVEQIWVDWLPAGPEEPEEGGRAMAARPDKFVYSIYEKYLTPHGRVRGRSDPEDFNGDEFGSLEDAVAGARAALAACGAPAQNLDRDDSERLSSITYHAAEIWRESWSEDDGGYVVAASRPEIEIDNLTDADRELARGLR